MMTPREMVEALEHDIFLAEEHDGDYKYLPEDVKARIHATALYLVLEGWTK